MSFCGVTVTANKLANLPICHAAVRHSGTDVAGLVLGPGASES